MTNDKKPRPAPNSPDRLWLSCGNEDGEHDVAAASEGSGDVTDHGSKSDLHPEYVTSGGNV